MFLHEHYVKLGLTYWIIRVYKNWRIYLNLYSIVNWIYYYRSAVWEVPLEIQHILAWKSFCRYAWKYFISPFYLQVILTVNWQKWKNVEKAILTMCFAFTRKSQQKYKWFNRLSKEERDLNMKLENKIYRWSLPTHLLLLLFTMCENIKIWNYAGTSVVNYIKERKESLHRHCAITQQRHLRNISSSNFAHRNA